MPRLRHVLIFTAIFLILDGWSGHVPWMLSGGVSYFFQIPAPLLALAATIWRARRVHGRARGLWTLLATGLTLWSAAMLMGSWQEWYDHLPFEAPSLADFAFFFYGVPILFALSTPAEGERLLLFSWLDSIQAFFAGYLAYIVIFSTSPFFDSNIRPLSTTLLVFTYNVENAALACGCALRLLASPRGEEHRFFRTLLVFLSTYALGVAAYNQSVIANKGQTPWSVLGDASFLILMLLIVALPEAQTEEEPAPAQRSRLALFIDNASPIFFTLALLALGMVTLRHHFLTGIIAVGVGLSAYGIRTTVLQLRYMRVQRELRAAHDRFERLSLQDGLTGIANRRHFDQTLDSEWRRAMRTHSSLSLLLIDLDYFKNLNDTYGHRYGDRCLVEVAAVLRSVTSRSGDLIARYGGEEFAAVLPMTTLEAARAIAEKMRESIQALFIANNSPAGDYLSISVGVCSCYDPANAAIEEMIEAADRALYRAKQRGRNRVEYAPPLRPQPDPESQPPHAESGTLFPLHET